MNNCLQENLLCPLPLPLVEQAISPFFFLVFSQFLFVSPPPDFRRLELIGLIPVAQSVFSQIFLLFSMLLSG